MQWIEIILVFPIRSVILIILHKWSVKTGNDELYFKIWNSLRNVLKICNGFLLNKTWVSLANQTKFWTKVKHINLTHNKQQKKNNQNDKINK